MERGGLVVNHIHQKESWGVQDSNFDCNLCEELKRLLFSTACNKNCSSSVLWKSNNFKNLQCRKTWIQPETNRRHSNQWPKTATLLRHLGLRHPRRRPHDDAHRQGGDLLLRRAPAPVDSLQVGENRTRRGYNPRNGPGLGQEHEDLWHQRRPKETGKLHNEFSVFLT